VSAVLSEPRYAEAAPDALRVAELTVELDSRRVLVGMRRVDLAPKEYELLLTLAAAPHRVFRKSELLRLVWDYHPGARTRTVDAHACRLRRKLDGDGPSRYVRNVWGYGYRLID
jgi:DNA-binding response OmpR family regulator